MQEILVSSLVSHKGAGPRVDITMPSNRVQLSAEEAINLAKQIHEAAIFAYADAFLFHFLNDTVLKDRMDAEQAKNVAGNMLSDFREYRDKLFSDFKSYQGETE